MLVLLLSVASTVIFAAFAGIGFLCLLLLVPILISRVRARAEAYSKNPETRLASAASNSRHGGIRVWHHVVDLTRRDSCCVLLSLRPIAEAMICR